MDNPQDKNSSSAQPTRKSTTRQALYRNWRPRSFKELVGQEHVTTTLENAIKNGRISHAYLFTGPRGVGKTSAARILAHLANGFDYTGEETHLDIIEIDAASNRRIDEIRDLRDKIAIAPAVGKYKVYIIDEVHMLTREAFNALLKTLEEPPAHSIFILATTEAHKLPETIISRTQRFEFKPLAGPKMAKHLAKIAKSENIEITPEALALLADFGGGSFRDSISYLDQFSTFGGKIGEDKVRAVLGLPSSELVNGILQQIAAGDSAGIINSLNTLKETGADAAAVAAELARAIRQQMVNGQGGQDMVGLLKDLIDVPASSRPYDYLEISLLQATANNTSQTVSQPAVKVAKPTKETLVKPAENKSQAAAISAPAQQVDKPSKLKQVKFDITLWPDVVNNSKQKAASLYTALRLADPILQDGVLVLRFQFPLHQKKLTQSANKALVESLINELSGQNINIECVVDKSAFKNRPAHSTPAAKTDSESKGSDHVSSISNIFGAAEVVEA